MLNTSLQAPNRHIHDRSAIDAMTVAKSIVTDVCVKRGQMIGFREQENEYLEAAIARAILAERQRIIDRLREEADLTPCSEDAMVTRSNARLVQADFDYEEAERLAEMEDASA